MEFPFQDVVKRTLFPVSISLYKEVVGPDTTKVGIQMTREFYSKYLQEDICKSKAHGILSGEKQQASKFQGRTPPVIQVLKKTKATILPVNMSVLRKRSGTGYAPNCLQ